MRPHLKLLLAFALALATPSAVAAPCAGFNDVDTSSGFCNNVAWVKNRGITLGCNATQYCPNDPVSRLQMAAFVNRLGNALTPTVVEVADSFTGSIATPVQFCVTQDFVAATYPRRAIVDVWATVGNPDVDMALAGHPDVSANAGATWDTFGHTTLQTLAAGTQLAPNVEAISAGGVLDLAAGSTYRFAFTLARAGTTGTTITAQCTLRVQIVNRTSAMAPL